MQTVLEALLFLVVVVTPALAATNFSVSRKDKQVDPERATVRKFRTAAFH